MPEMSKPLPQEARWIIEVGDFVSIYLLNQPFINQTQCMAPDASPDDGCLWLLLIRKGVTKKDLNKFMAAADSGGKSNLTTYSHY